MLANNLVSRRKKEEGRRKKEEKRASKLLGDIASKNVDCELFIKFDMIAIHALQQISANLIQ
ncbi:MAG: hypothetical protein ACRC62_06620 [Microcoleus sp.]